MALNRVHLPASNPEPFDHVRFIFRHLSESQFVKDEPAGKGLGL